MDLGPTRPLADWVTVAHDNWRIAAPKVHTRQFRLAGDRKTEKKRQGGGGNRPGTYSCSAPGRADDVFDRLVGWAGCAGWRVGSGKRTGT